MQYLHTPITIQIWSLVQAIINYMIADVIYTHWYHRTELNEQGLDNNTIHQKQ